MVETVQAIRRRKTMSRKAASPPERIRKGAADDVAGNPRRSWMKGPIMLKWALIFFVISLVAGFLGFSGISAATAGIAKILFYIAVIIFLVFLVLALAVGGAVT